MRSWTGDLGTKKKGRKRLKGGHHATGTGVAKLKKKVKGWSTEEMKDQANRDLEEYTEEMRTWRGLNQDEMDQCWKKSAGRMEEEVLDKYKVKDSKKRGLQRQRLPAEMEARAKKQKKTG